MNAFNRYWIMCRLSRTGKEGYQRWPSKPAKAFLNTFPSLAEAIASPNTRDEDIQAILFSLFKAVNPSDDNEMAAKAGLNLRCYVSQPILQACKERACLFSGNTIFQELLNRLLNRVLNDDGETLVVVDDASKQHYILNCREEIEPTQYHFVSVEALTAYNPNVEKRLSLQNWAYYFTRRHPQVKAVLTEVGFHGLSDWALLNRARASQMEQVSERSRHLIQVFHAVYRRDRRQRSATDPVSGEGQSSRSGRCPDPSNIQLEEMLKRLQEMNVMVASTTALLNELHQVAAQLRQFDIWNQRKAPMAETLEFYNAETGTTTLRQDLPNPATNEVDDVENDEMLAFIRQQLDDALEQGIERGIDDKLQALKKGRRAKIAPKYIPGLKMYYCEQKSTREIANAFGLSQSQVSRVLSPEELRNQVRFRTTEKLLDMILVRVHELGLTDIPPKPNYLSHLVSQLEAFIDDEVFHMASTELRAGKGRTLDSRYAQYLCHYLSQI